MCFVLHLNSWHSQVINISSYSRADQKIAAMSWSCIICEETLQEEIFSTLCGHLFHFHCISQWLERSNTCPQCCVAVSLTSLLRIFPNPQSITNGEIEEQRDINKKLTNEIADLKQEISTKIKRSEIKKISSYDEVHLNKNQALISKCDIQNLIKLIDAKCEENQKVLSDLKKRVEPFESYNSELKSLVEDKSDLAAVLLSVKDDLGVMKRNMFEVEGAIATVSGQINTEKEKPKQQTTELAKLKRKLESNKENEARGGPTLRSSKRIPLQARDKNAAGNEETKQKKMELAKLQRELESNKENEARVGPTLRSSKRNALKAQDKNAAGTAGT